jgi:hypothetical protein
MMSISGLCKVAAARTSLAVIIDGAVTIISLALCIFAAWRTVSCPASP